MRARAIAAPRNMPAAWSSCAIGAPKSAMTPSTVKLVDCPLEAVHPAVHDPIPLLRIDLLAEIHRASEIREEHGHLLTLALEGAARRENLLGEVLRCVGAGIR